MSERANDLADQFAQASSDFLASVTALPESKWNIALSSDPRTAGVIAHHVASGYESTTSALQGLLAGIDLGLTWDVIHGGNAAHALEHHGVGQDETVSLLKANGARTESFIRALSDAQLDQMVDFSLFSEDPIPAQAVIEGLIIGHIRMHSADFGD